MMWSMLILTSLCGVAVLGVKDTPPASVFAVTFEHYEKYLRFLYPARQAK